MLPSQGLFRSIPCPFYLAGLCERPHCSYRHCRSDIRIDRKLETESLDDPSLEEGQEEGLPPSLADGVSSHPPTKNAAVSSIKEPVVNVNNKISITGETVSGKSNPTERLKTAETVPSVSRKRSCDKDSDSLNKRRRVSEEGSSKMGSVLSTVAGSVAGVCQSALNSCLPKSESKTDTLPDIDELVREIENAGKPSDSQRRQSDHHKHKKSKKHKHHRHRDSDSSSVSPDSPSKDKRHSSSSHRKENKSNDEDLRKKDKERGDSKKDGHGKHDHSWKRESSSKSSSIKDPKSHRKSSSSSETRPSRRDRKSDAASHSSPSTPKKERRPSGSSSGKGSSDSAKEVCKPASPTIDISNRFNALAESSADESAYNSDIFEDTSLNYAFVGGSDSEEDPEIVARECLEMFENYKPDEQIKPVQKSAAESEKKEDGPEEGFCMVGKKRVAHSNAVGKSPSTSAFPLPQKKPSAPATSKNLQDTLFRRFEDQSTIRTNTQNGSSSTFAPPAPAPAKPVGKSRIAHVPNAGKLAQKPTSNTTKTSSSAANAVPGRPGALTYSQTAAKGVPRAAHKPSTSITSKPGPTVFRDAISKSSKIPHNTRQAILDKMYSEYVRILEDSEKAFDITVRHENELQGRCSSKQVYYSSGISAISGLRKTNKPDDDRATNSRLMSHADMLTGSLESRNCSFRASKKDVSLPEGNKLYKALLRYLMNEDQLQENGYPRPHPSGENGRVTAKPRQGDNVTMTLTNRVCDRCKGRYKTTEDGEHLISEVCNYHWGRKYNMMSRMGRGMREASYSCCGSDDDKIGCVTAPCHVSKSPIALDSQKGFVCAVYEEADVEEMGLGRWDIIGIDCEMVYTTHGNELARVTVTAVNGEVLYDDVVKPTHRVLDPNTRFSGLTFDDLDKATKTITDVQAVLLTYLRPNTITIGHSLESDLIALRVRHDYVIDTSLLYPHRMGPPKKRALKTLSAEILQKVIQDSDSGHDSAEDARIAVELVLAKLKSDLASK